MGKATLYEAITGLQSASAFKDACSAVESGKLLKDSTSAIIEEVASGRPQAYDSLKALQQLWQSSLETFDGPHLSVLMRQTKKALSEEQCLAPKTQVVWTGPNVEGSFLRATRQVVQDIVNGAKKELLVVGYWIAAKEDNEGIISDVIKLIAAAVNRGVKVAMVLDQSEKPYGKSNKAILAELWPDRVDLPALYTWKIPDGDRHLKLHAKVLVADRHDALVTSANLTMYAMDKNMEMGVRVIGNPGKRITDHFDLLIGEGILVEWEGP